MQLLEQLAGGYSEVGITAEGMMLECASVGGYIQCMTEMYEVDVLTEGVDFKSIGDKVVKFIKSIIEKIRNLGKRILGFLRGLFNKFKKGKSGDSKKDDKKDDKEDNGDDGRVRGLTGPASSSQSSSNSGSSSSSQSSSNTGSSSSSQSSSNTSLSVRSSSRNSSSDRGQKRLTASPLGISHRPSDEELVRDRMKSAGADTYGLGNNAKHESPTEKVLSSLPYTGPHPTGIKNGINKVSNVVTSGLGTNVYYFITQDMKLLRRTMTVNDSDSEDNLRAIEKECKKSDSEKLNDIFAKLADDSGISINKPDDIAKAIEKAYDTGRQHMYDNNTVYKLKDIDFLSEVIESTKANIREDILPNLISRIENCINTIESRRKDCNDIEKMLSNIEDGEYKNNAQSILNNMMKDWSLIAASYTNALSAIPVVMGKAEADVSTCEKWLDSVKSKLKSI